MSEIPRFCPEPQDSTEFWQPYFKSNRLIQAARKYAQTPSDRPHTDLGTPYLHNIMVEAGVIPPGPDDSRLCALGAQLVEVGAAPADASGFPLEEMRQKFIRVQQEQSAGNKA